MIRSVYRDNCVALINRRASALQTVGGDPKLNDHGKYEFYMSTMKGLKAKLARCRLLDNFPVLLTAKVEAHSALIERKPDDRRLVQVFVDSTDDKVALISATK